MKQSYEHKSPLLPPGLSPVPPLYAPTTPGSGVVSCSSGVAVSQKGEDTPLHPPSARGDRGVRQANQKPKVEYWRELLAYVDATYVKKLGRHYPWSNLARKNLCNLARVHNAWGGMALWELYLDSQSWWARETHWSVYGMVRETGRLLDDSRFKHLALKHEEWLGSRQIGRFVSARDVLNWFRDTPIS